MGGCVKLLIELASAAVIAELRAGSLIWPRRAREATRWMLAVGEGIGTWGNTKYEVDRG